jgi:VanZ family protein
LADRRGVLLRWAAVLAWAACLAAVSVVPGPAIPGRHIPGLDKVAHFGFYLILALLAQRATRKSCLAYSAVVTLSCGVFGAVLEVVQGFLPGRSSSVADGIANVVGAAAGSAVYILWVRRRRKT